MITVTVHGHLREHIGRAQMPLAIHSASEAVRALECNFPGFMSELREGNYHVVKGNPRVDGVSLDAEWLASPLPMSVTELHFIPVPQGSGGGKNGKGIFSMILGVALIAAAFWTGGGTLAGAFSILGVEVSFTQIALIGASMFLQGAAALLTPSPKVADYTQRERPEERASFIFNGPVNVTQPGAAVPICYGKFLVGSVVLSGALISEDVEDTVEAREKLLDYRYQPHGVNIGVTIESTGVDQWDTEAVANMSLALPHHTAKIEWYHVPTSGSEVLLQTDDQVPQSELPKRFTQTDTATLVNKIVVRARYKTEDEDGIPLSPIVYRYSSPVTASIPEADLQARGAVSSAGAAFSGSGAVPVAGSDAAGGTGTGGVAA